MDWSQDALVWRVGLWFVLGLGVSAVNHRLVAGALARAAADPQRGATLVMSRYLVRMVTNFGMIFVAYLVDGHLYVLLATLAGLLSLTVILAITRLMVKEGTP